MGKKRDAKEAFIRDLAAASPVGMSRATIDKYSEDEPRDEHGQWASGAGTAASDFKVGEHVRVAPGRYDSGIHGRVVAGDPSKTHVRPERASRVPGALLPQFATQRFVAVRDLGSNASRQLSYHLPEELERHPGGSSIPQSYVPGDRTTNNPMGRGPRISYVRTPGTDPRGPGAG